ncbi:hypothetical protein D3C71_2015450 [compost metagenome]
MLTGAASSKLKLAKVCATGPCCQYDSKKSTERSCDRRTVRSSWRGVKSSMLRYSKLR